MQAQEQRAKVMMLIDFENLLRNIELTPPEHFSLMDGFDRLIRQISQEVGEIVNVLVFAPSHLATAWAEDLHRLGFFTILCPRITNKEGEQEDTTDAMIMEFGRKTIHHHNITHLCLCSGDKDFGPFLRDVIRQGLKIVIAAGNLTSLSNELIRLADKKKTGEKMVYILSPTRE